MSDPKAQGRPLFITGTGTGVGKTVLTTLLARRARESGVTVAALKPFCSGGRADARALHAACGRSLSLEEVNPWWYRAALSPAIAAEAEGARVSLKEAVTHVRRFQTTADLILVEGAGGLLSPLGVDFDSRDFIVELQAIPIVVATNVLGAIHAVRATWEALPARARRSAQLALMPASRPTRVSRTNARFLREALGAAGIVEFPWMPRALEAAEIPRSARAPLDAVLRGQPQVRSARVAGSDR